MGDLKKGSLDMLNKPNKTYRLLCLLPLLLLHDCTQIPDYCSAHNPLDPLRQFCHEGLAVDKCGGKTFDPSTQVCDDEIVKNQTAYLSVYIEPADGGTVSLNPPSDDVSNHQNGSKHGYGIKTKVTATAEPDGDYEFAGWAGAETSGGAEVAVMMDGDDRALTAKFRLKRTVTVSSAGTGSSGSGKYAAGETVTIFAGTALTSQTFKNWTTLSNGVTFADANSETTTFTMPANAVTVTAVFEIFVEKGTFFDSRDNQEYKTVQIGSQVWMAENLNYATKTDEGNSWCYKNNNSNCNTYGRLYNWATAMAGSRSSVMNPSGVRGVCPEKWHLPSRQEWNDLVDYAGGYSNAGKKLKATSGWNSNGNGTDDFGFSALPGGYRNIVGSFFGAGDYGDWWTATENVGSKAYCRYMGCDDDYVYEGDYDINSIGYSVRCVQD